jgi:hypothetical protein
VPVLERRIVAEYADVLGRWRFVARVEAALDAIAALLRIGCDASAVIVPHSEPLPDEGDRVFVEVALGTGAPLITGNISHFPEKLGIEVVTPAEMARRLGG